MATIKILLGIICLIIIGCSSLLGSNSLKNTYRAANEEVTTHRKLLNIARAQIGVRELTGKNDGVEVESYLKYVKMRKGEPWCAAFVSWVFWKAGFLTPRTAWAPSLFPKQYLVRNSGPGLVFGIYIAKLKRIAHCGFVEKSDGSWLLTIEGNTNNSGSREGDGVYRKRRHIKTICSFANWSRTRKEPKP